MIQRSHGSRWNLRRQGLICIDFLLSFGAVLLAYATYPTFAFGWNSPNAIQPSLFQTALIFPWVVLLTMHVAGLHDPLGDRRLWLASLRISAAVGAAVGLCLLFFYIVFFQKLGRIILLGTFLYSFVLLGGVRFLLWRLALASPRKIGCLMPPGDEAALLKLIAENNLPLNVFIPDERSRQFGVEAVADFFVQSGVEEVVVDSRAAQQEAWFACLNRGIQITDLVVFVEREYYKVPCESISISWFLQFDLKWSHPYYFRVKRLLDVMVALIGITLSIPVGVLAGLAIILESGFPIFYSQLRVGFQGRPYRIWKLRSMCNHAEKGGARWASCGDSRVTAVGRFLRRTRIDELPQFWNVLMGNMSVIGPRPERPEFVEQLAKEIPMYPQRHWLKPGITGWAQINFPYGASVEDSQAKLCYDLYYIKHASLLLDLHIALRTLGVIMKGSR